MKLKSPCPHCQGVIIYDERPDSTSMCPYCWKEFPTSRRIYQAFRQPETLKDAFYGSLPLTFVPLIFGLYNLLHAFRHPSWVTADMAAVPLLLSLVIFQFFAYTLRSKELRETEDRLEREHEFSVKLNNMYQDAKRERDAALAKRI